MTKSNNRAGEFAHLSDKELAKRLKSEFGYYCGPVNVFTRSVYEIKLAKFIEERDASQRITGASLPSTPSAPSSSSASSSTPKSTASSEKTASIPYSLRLRPSSRKSDSPKAASLVHQVSDQTPQQYDQANYHGHFDRTSDSVSEWTSYSIVGLFCLFFLLVSIFYLYSRLNFQLGSTDIMGPKISNPNIDWNQLNAPLCQGDVREVCVKNKDRIKPSILVLRYILYHIEKGLIDHYCSRGEAKEGDGIVFTTNQLRKALQVKADELDEKLKQIVSQEEKQKIGENMLYQNFFTEALSLIEANPEFKMSYHDDGGKSYVKVDSDYPISLPTECVAKRLLWRNGKYSLIIMAVTSIIAGAYWFYSHKKRRESEDQKMVLQLVAKTLELLRSPDEPRSTLVNNIRDTLLLPSQRKDNRWKRIWTNVVNYIETHEHRVKATLEEINGEEFKTWKWCGDYFRDGPRDIRTRLGVLSSYNSSLNATVMQTGTIKWQGSAFGSDTRTCEDLMAESPCDDINSIYPDSGSCNGSKASYNNFVAPTRFLKVRNMYSDDTKNTPNWRNSIYNAILEKCSNASPTGQHGIQHMHIGDRDSVDSPVYIKCDSIESASIAFKALHGQWCELHLVSVKFLREDRYYTRFPEAATMNSPLSSDNYCSKTDS